MTSAIRLYIVISFWLAFTFAVIYRDAISDWLVSVGTRL